MGIRGLETFLNNMLIGPSRNLVYTDRRLADIRFVVDGNQFSYFLSSIFEKNRTGGNYDQYYEFLRRILKQLAPFIEIVIFDGCKEFQAKARRRLENKCEQLSGLSGEYKSVVEFESFLSHYPALFNRMILYEVLHELTVKVCHCLIEILFYSLVQFNCY